MRDTVKRWVAKVVLRSSPTWLITGVSLLASSQSNGGDMASITAIGWIITGLYVLIILPSPYLIYSLYVGKTWASQPWLFGFEDYIEIGEIERLIFGINLGRLRWSPYSSDLSLHHKDQNGEREGKDPMFEDSTKKKKSISTAQNSEYGELKLFTLIDTNTLTVTLLRTLLSSPNANNRLGSIVG